MPVVRPHLVRTLLLAVALASAGRAHAQPFDHLECYKIKDFAPKVKYHADLTPEQTQFLAQTGCELKVPAKLFCVNTEKSNVVPAPPLALNGQDTRDFLCYNVKCPKLNLNLAVEDQFGTRNITAKKPFQLCAPARQVGDPDPATPTPCLPPATPVPTVTAAPTCTDGMQNGGESDIDCGGPCPACVLGDGCFVASDCQSTYCTAGQCTVCSPGQTQSCGTMLPGACALGLRTCQMNGTYGSCVPPSGTPETCNNVDDNCDGMVDNGLGSTTCGTGACQNTVPNCIGGVPQFCTPNLPSTETCNNVDDNCDGMVDNNACPVLPNTAPSCNGVSCSYVCSAGYSDCNGNMMADGCEVNVLGSDNANCGACGFVCSGMCVSGVCKQPNGAACGSASNCQSNNCVDGVCCNVACSGVCQACVASQTGIANGTCANITAGTDPASECPGAQNCNGAGACL
jgi:hypothetical protein